MCWACAQLWLTRFLKVQVSVLLFLLVTGFLWFWLVEKPELEWNDYWMLWEGEGKSLSFHSTYIHYSRPAFSLCGLVLKAWCFGCFQIIYFCHIRRTDFFWVCVCVSVCLKHVIVYNFLCLLNCWIKAISHWQYQEIILNVNLMTTLNSWTKFQMSMFPISVPIHPDPG